MLTRVAASAKVHILKQGRAKMSEESTRYAMLKYKGKTVRVVFQAYGDLSNKEAQECLIAIMENGVKPFLHTGATVADVANTM
jgi:hypothetical protein